MTATPAAANAGQGNQVNGRCMSCTTINQAASEPAMTPKRAVADADQQVLDPVGRNQMTPRRAKRFQDHRVVNPMAMAGRECPAEHQRGGDKRDGAGAANGQHQVGHNTADCFQRLFYAHGGDHRE